MKDIDDTNRLIRLRDRADQLASTASAVSDAATYSPDDISGYTGALVLLASLMRQFADDFESVVNG